MVAGRVRFCAASEWLHALPSIRFTLQPARRFAYMNTRRDAADGHFFSCKPVRKSCWFQVSTHGGVARCPNGQSSTAMYRTGRRANRMGRQSAERARRRHRNRLSVFPPSFCPFREVKILQQKVQIFHRRGEKLCYGKEDKDNIFYICPRGGMKHKCDGLLFHKPDKFGGLFVPERRK